MVEVISQIKAAEDGAEELRRQARRDAAALRDNATAEGKRLLENEAAAAAAKAAELELETRRRNDAYLARRREEAAQRCERLTAEARQKMDAAAQLIVERIVDSL